MILEGSFRQFLSRETDSRVDQTCGVRENRDINFTQAFCFTRNDKGHRHKQQCTLITEGGLRINRKSVRAMGDSEDTERCLKELGELGKIAQQLVALQVVRNENYVEIEDD